MLSNGQPQREVQVRTENSERATRTLWSGLTNDLRATLRGLNKRRGFALTAIITLALGVGATTAVFTVVDSILLRPLPYRNSEALVAVWPGTFVGNKEIDAVRTRTQSFSEVASFSPGWLLPLTDVPVPRQMNAGRVSGNLLSMLGSRPMLGRIFETNADLPGNGNVTILGHEVWRTSFNSDSAIVGRSIMLGGSPYTVIGVMPAGFQLFDVKSDLWTPLTVTDNEAGSSFIYARLKNGVGFAKASTEMTALTHSLQQELARPAAWAAITPLVSLRESVVGGMRQMLWLLFGGVLFLLLIATSNVANLLLVRAAERQPELALRQSLGAPKWRIARLLIGESLMLALVGGALGVGIAYLVVSALPAILPQEMLQRSDLHLDARVLIFAAAVTVLPGLLLGLAPVVVGWRQGFANALRTARSGARTGERTRGVLVSVEVALALVLMVGASLMGRSLIALMNVDSGVRTHHVLTALVQPATITNSDAVRVFWREALTQVEQIPGVVSAGTILHLPMSGRTWMADVELENEVRPAGEPPGRTAWQSVSPHYFAAAGVPVTQGRAFEDSDRSDALPVIIVNSVFAARHFRGENPIGRRVKAGRATNGEWATVVGVVGAVRHDSLNAAPTAEVYVPFEQKLVGATSLVVETRGEPTAVAASIRERIWAINRNVTIDNMRTMDDIISASLVRPRLLLIVLGALAVTGMLLGAIGIYGVVAYGVQQRTRELGIRAALGADAGSLKRLVVSAGVRFAIAGVVVGVPVALGLSRALQGLLFGVAPTDLVSFSLVSFGLIGVAVAASWVPARRASRADPMKVLRDG